MISDEKLRSELLKEVLGRANKLEKQEYEKINKRQSTIAVNDVALVKKWNELTELSKRNECPNETAESKNHKPVSAMSMEEFNQYMAANRKYSKDSFDWISENTAICTEMIKITREILESVIELWNLAEEEKWLLLSIALRSQPNLLKYLKN
jgi:hypothetical protein